jgi:hypothetical protein
VPRLWILWILLSGTAALVALIGGASACTCPGWSSESGDWTVYAARYWSMSTNCCDGDLCYECVYVSGSVCPPDAGHRGYPYCDCGGEVCFGSFSETCCGWCFRDQYIDFMGCQAMGVRHASTKWTGPNGEVCYSGWGEETPASADCGYPVPLACPKE